MTTNRAAMEAARDALREITEYGTSMARFEPETTEKIDRALTALEAALAAPETGAGVKAEWQEAGDGDWRLITCDEQESQLGFVFGSDADEEGVPWLRYGLPDYAERGVAPTLPAAKAAVEASFRSALSRLTGGAGVPKGWRLVPVEPTPEIKRAIIEAVTVKYEGACDVYAAMLSAAPMPPAKGGEDA